MKNIENFISNRDGNVAVIFAVAALFICTIVGFAVDITRAESYKMDLQNIADLAALAGATATVNDNHNREAYVSQAISENLNAQSGIMSTKTPYVDFDDSSGIVEVKLEAPMPTVFGKFLNKDEIDVKARSLAAYGPATTEPIAIMFVLDVSGSMHASMGSNSRLDVLQETLASLFADLDMRKLSESTLDDYVYTGLTAYNGVRRTDLEVDLNPGWSDTQSMVANLSTGLGTVPSHTLAAAYQMLVDKRSSYSATDVREIIVYMTDGEIDEHLFPSENVTQDTLDTCQQAKSDGVEIYAIGMGAPSSARDVLLQCGSPDGSRDNYDAVAQAVDANCNVNKPTCESAKSVYYANISSKLAFEAYVEQVRPELGDPVIRLVQ